MAGGRDPWLSTVVEKDYPWADDWSTLPDEL
jgi:hypothetical protein